MHKVFFSSRFKYLLLFFLLGLSTVVRAFQTAESTPSNEKYIFYWGNLQGEMTEANGFADTLFTTPAAFRRMLLAPPHLWDGKVLHKDFSFFLEGRQVNTADYSPLIGLLDTAFGRKVVPGQVLHITRITLSEQRTGTIELRIEAPKEPDNTQREINWLPNTPNLLASTLAAQVIWGQEEAYDISNRDFFTVAEFWQTVRLQPYVEWQPNATPQGLSAAIRFPDLKTTTFSVTARLEKDGYRQLLADLENFRHLVYPGATVELALYTTETYDDLYQKSMTLVPDNDPRLALRRNRNLHTAALVWGGWHETIPDLYLVRLPDAHGVPRPVDRPVSRQLAITRDRLAAMLGGEPILQIDKQAVPNLSFRLSTPAYSQVIDAEHPLPDSLAREIVSAFALISGIQLDSFIAPGYDLPPFSFQLRFIDIGPRLPVRNDFNSLMAAEPDRRVKLSRPGISAAGYFFDFDVPESGPLTFSIFDSTGQNLSTTSDTYAAGPHTMRITPEVFQRAGKYFCFLNTQAGVGKLEFEVGR